MLKLIAMYFLLISPLHAAGIYKWIDKNNNTHYTDKPVENAVTVNIKNIPEDDETLTREQRELKRKRLLEAFKHERLSRNEQKKYNKQAELVREKKCAKAQQRLKNIASATGLYYNDENNQRVFLTQEQESLARKSATQDVSDWCD